MTNNNAKPVAYLELRARVRAILWRTMQARAKSPRRVGALVIDPDGLEARYAGTRLELSRLEFALLGQLAADPLRVFTKARAAARRLGLPDGGGDANA